MAQNELDSVDELLRRGRYPEAIERFRSRLSVDPENADLRARCAEAYRLAGNGERAFHHYNKAAGIYARNGDAHHALAMLQAANAVAPNEPDIVFRMAECKKALGDGASIEPLCRQLLVIAKGSGDRRRLWALDELCARHPDDLDLAIRRAETLTEAGRVNEAVQAWKVIGARTEPRGLDLTPMLTRAAALAPERTDVGVDLANILLASRRPREALALLVPFYEKAPDDVGVLATLLGSLEALGATDKIVPARIELIKARAKKNQREAALRDIATLLHQAPDDLAALEVCAHAYAAFGDHAESVAMWRRITHLSDRTGRRAERDRAILALLKANPDDEDALAIGARALAEAGRAEEAAVLEHRLRALGRIRARSALPSKTPAPTPPPARPAPASARPTPAPQPRALVPTPRPRPSSAATVLFTGEEVAKRTPELATEAGQREPGFEDDPSMISPSDLSEPSVEPMPITHHPLVEGLELSGRRPPSVTQPRTVIAPPAPKPQPAKAAPAAAPPTQAPPRASTSRTRTTGPTTTRPAQRPATIAPEEETLDPADALAYARAPTITRPSVSGRPVSAPSSPFADLTRETTRPYPSGRGAEEVWQSAEETQGYVEGPVTLADAGEPAGYEEETHAEASAPSPEEEAGTMLGYLGLSAGYEIESIEEVEPPPEEATSRFEEPLGTDVHVRVVEDSERNVRSDTAPSPIPKKP